MFLAQHCLLHRGWHALGQVIRIQTKEHQYLLAAMAHTWELGDVKMKAVPIPQPPSPTITGSNQPLRRGTAADSGVDEAEKRAASDDLGVRVVDEVPAGAEHRGAEALGAGAHGENGAGAVRVLRGGEEEGGEDRRLAPLRLAFLGKGAVVPERRRGRGFRPGGGDGGALLRRRRGGGGHHRRRRRIVVKQGNLKKGIF